MRTWAVIHKVLSRSEVNTQLRNNFEHVIEQNKINHAWQLNQTNNQSINHKEITYIGPPQKPDLFLHELVSQIPLYWNCKNHINAYIKTKKNRRFI